MRSLAILADDLTGALDTAAPFATNSEPVRVSWWDGLLSGEPRIAFDTESRDLAGDEAATRVACALTRFGGAGLRFKKLDSLIRGNTLIEAANCTASPAFRSVVIAPAFPEQDRITRCGTQIAPDRNGRATPVADLAAGGAHEPIRIGVIAAEGGRLAFAAIDRAVRDAMADRIGAIVTGPISKEAINLAGHAYSGHTEMLADLTGSRDTCILLAHDKLRVAHVSTHVARARVPSLVTPERITRVLDLTIEALRRFGIAAPRIAVAALNPHAGEGGLFGREDTEVIAPTVKAYRRGDADVTGPISGDTVFVRALGGEFDAVIAMYHDQGHIPLKLLGFHIDPATRNWTALSGVNITLGLPFLRTSVDHGTAFDIAGKGIASAQSMVEAIDFALAMSGRGAASAGPQ